MQNRRLIQHSHGRVLLTATGVSVSAVARTTRGLNSAGLKNGFRGGSFCAAGGAWPAAAHNYQLTPLCLLHAPAEWIVHAGMPGKELQRYSMSRKQHEDTGCMAFVKIKKILHIYFVWETWDSCVRIPVVMPRNLRVETWTAGDRRILN